MSTHESAKALKEMERILNDPAVPFRPDRVWDLVAEISAREGDATVSPGRMADGAFRNQKR